MAKKKSPPSAEQPNRQLAALKQKLLNLEKKKTERIPTFPEDRQAEAYERVDRGIDQVKAAIAKLEV